MVEKEGSVVSEKPRKRDSIGTQDKILAAAQMEFARRGYDGARVDAIIARAKISKNLLYHHFSSKEELYVKVLERTYEAMRRRQEEIPLTGLEPVAAIRRLCDATFQTFIEEPEVIVMMNSENIHRGRHVAKSPIIRQLYSRLAGAVDAILREGERKGVFRPGVDAIDLYISISAMGYFYISNRFTLSMIFDRDLMRSDYLEQHRATIIDMTLAYLTEGAPNRPQDDGETSQDTSGRAPPQSQPAAPVRRKRVIAKV